MNWLVLIQALAPVIGPLLTALVSALIPSLPAKWKPIVATVAGAATASLGGADPSSSLALGLAGVGVREVVNQHVTKAVTGGGGNTP